MRSKFDPRMRKEINNENNIRVKPAGAPTEYTMNKDSTETNTENNTLKTEKKNITKNLINSPHKLSIIRKK